MTTRVPPTEPADNQLLEFEDWLFKKVESIPQKKKDPARGKALLKLILEIGEVSTDEFEARGYKHPPSAKRDARNRNFPVETKLKTLNGKSQGVYYLTTAMTEDRVVGALRKGFPAKFRRDLLKHYGDECMVCKREGSEGVGKKMQPDHRVPFDIAGDTGLSMEEFMPLCGSCNRTKSWACEHCPNWDEGIIEVCMSCYWGIPDGDYQHVATRLERRSDIVWEEDEVADYITAKDIADSRGISMADLIKSAVRSIGTSQLHPDETAR